MATWDKAKLRLRVMQNLNVLGAGQDLSSDDAEIVDEAIDAAFAEFRSLDLANFTLDSIPEYAQLAMRDYVSSKIAGMYSLAPERRLQIIQMGDLARMTLREQMYSYDSIVISTPYF